MMIGMTARQLLELELFYSIEPFGEFRHELRNGMGMALLANINRDPKAKPEPFSASDFMRFIEHEPEPQLTQEEKDAMIDRILGV